MDLINNISKTENQVRFLAETLAEFLKLFNNSYNKEILDRNIWIEKPKQVTSPQQKGASAYSPEGLTFFDPKEIFGNISLATLSLIGFGPQGFAAWFGESIIEDIVNISAESLHEKQRNQIWNQYNQQFADLLKWANQGFDIISLVKDSTKISDVDIWQEWIKNNKKSAEELKGTWLTAIEEIKRIQNEGSSEEKERYKEIIENLSFFEDAFFESFNSAYNQISSSVNGNGITNNINGKNVNPTQSTSNKMQNSQLFQPTINEYLTAIPLYNYVVTQNEIATDFVSPGERGHMPAAEEMEKIKSLQQIPIMIDNSAESMSKMKSNTKDAKDNTFVLSHTLSDVARYAGQIGGAFMGVNEEIGRAISSAGTLTEGVAGIFKAFEGDKVNGLGLMSGIQGGFAGLQGLFGGEPGSDSSQLLGGMGGVGAGIAGLLTFRATGSFQLRLANA